MRIQALFFLVILAAFYEFECQETTTTTAAATTKDSNDWDFNENYTPDQKKQIAKPKPKAKSKPKAKPKPKKPRNRDDDSEQDQDVQSSESRSKGKRKSPNSVGHIYVYVREDGSKKLKRFRFPIAHYNRRRFPQFGPLLNYLPWLPIFIERRTKQTIIYSPTGGVYILPPVVNFYGDVYSVGELIVSGYASLVSSGSAPTPSLDVAPLVQHGAVVGPGIPTVDPATGGFTEGVRTELGTFTDPQSTSLYIITDNYQPQEQRRRPQSVLHGY